MSQIIPSSKWVKVDWENNGKYYVIGLIYAYDVLKYVCYGVPVANESDIIDWVAYELGEKFHCAIYPDQFEIVNLDEILLAI